MNKSGASDLEKSNNGIFQKYCKFKQRSGLLDVSDGTEVKIKDMAGNQTLFPVVESI